VLNMGIATAHCLHGQQFLPHRPQTIGSRSILNVPRSSTTIEFGLSPQDPVGIFEGMSPRVVENAWHARNPLVAMTVLLHKRHTQTAIRAEITVTTALLCTRLIEIVEKSLQDHLRLVHEAGERGLHLPRSHVTCSNRHRVHHHEGIKIKIQTMVG
jgi:hypothetical protein